MHGGLFRKNGNAVWLAYLQGRMASSSSSSLVGGGILIASFHGRIGALKSSFLMRISRIIPLRKTRQLVYVNPFRIQDLAFQLSRWRGYHNADGSLLAFLYPGAGAGGGQVFGYRRGFRDIISIRGISISSVSGGRGMMISIGHRHRGYTPLRLLIPLQLSLQRNRRKRRAMREIGKERGDFELSLISQPISYN